MPDQPTLTPDEAYALVPKIECKGLCWQQCTITAANADERTRMTAAGGEGRKSRRDPLRCRYLSRNNRCTVYAVRPLLCRLYGVSVGLECPHGCKPERLLTREEASRLIRALYPQGVPFDQTLMD